MKPEEEWTPDIYLINEYVKQSLKNLQDRKNDGQRNFRGWNLQDWKMSDKSAGLENAGLENNGQHKKGGKRRTSIGGQKCSR